jgi:hypothetical protein
LINSLSIATIYLSTHGHTTQVRLTLDRLFYAHRDLFRKRVASRPYDLPTALDLLAEGTTVQRFPR